MAKGQALTALHHPCSVTKKVTWGPEDCPFPSVTLGAHIHHKGASQQAQNVSCCWPPNTNSWKPGDNPALCIIACTCVFYQGSLKTSPPHLPLSIPVSKDTNQGPRDHPTHWSPQAHVHTPRVLTTGPENLPLSPKHAFHKSGNHVTPFIITDICALLPQGGVHSSHSQPCLSPTALTPPKCAIWGLAHSAQCSNC